MRTEEYLELQFEKFALRVPKGLRYAGYDSWVRVEGDEGVVGVTDYYETHVGDIVYVDPVQATSIEQDEVMATLESVKATVDITCPASGEVIAFNSKLDEQPQLVNEDPYGEGWIVRLRLTDWELDQGMLLPAEAYLKVMKDKIARELDREQEGA